MPEKFLAQLAWKQDRSVISHLVVDAKTEAEALADAKAKHPEHDVISVQEWAIPSSAPAAEAPSSAPADTLELIATHKALENGARFDAESSKAGDWPWYVLQNDITEARDPRAIRCDGEWRVYFDTAFELCCENGFDVHVPSAPALPKLWKATVELYLDVPSGADACDAVAEMLRENMRRYTESDDSCLIDWQYAPDHSMPVEATAAEVAQLEEFSNG